MNERLPGQIGIVVIIANLIGLTAAAQTFETLVMPGEVISGHADIEDECSSCHKPFDRSGQIALCLDCHEDVAGDIDMNTGFHGRSDAVQGSPCMSCHTEHEGRSADILGLDDEQFDHLLTDFELLGLHLETECVDCHKPDVKHRDAPGECIDCHEADDVHKGNLGLECAECHNPNDWAEFEFDHGTTNFPLVGMHRENECRDCHLDETHQDTPTTCFGCHADDDFHSGRSGEQCENCHNPESWADTSFNHARDTNFMLEGSHAELTCDDCHSEDPFSDENETDCVACHVKDDDHDGHNGTDCAGCHSPTVWTESMFDHDANTDFVLNGTHATTECVDCHIEPVFDVSPGSECASCHLDDDMHDGLQGDQCDDCHNEQSWEEAPFFDHDLTAFPLLGEHDNVECESCHDTRVFASTESECSGCHLDDDPHGDTFNDTCDTCHNPVAWDLWLFDHNVLTDFTLEGAHVDVACGDCHRSSMASMKRIGEQCADCHRADDIHDDEYGQDCGRCHGNTSFKEVRSLQ